MERINNNNKEKLWEKYFFLLHNCKNTLYFWMNRPTCKQFYHFFFYFEGKVYRAGCRLEADKHPTVEFRSSHRLLGGQTDVMQDGSQVLARCRDLHSAFTGENIITCEDGHWSPTLPRCTKTYQAWRGFGVLLELTYIMSC